jgi:hypothetical protein
MAENGSPEQENVLTPKQEMLIAALIAGNTIAVAVKAIGIGERTAYTWLKQPLFQQAYRDAKQRVYDEALEGLRDCTKEAIDTLKRNLNALEPSVQVRAAQIILTQSIQFYKIEAFEQRVIELEEKVKAMQK